MARPKKADAPDTSKPVDLTAGVIERLTCRTDIKAQAFLRDSKVPGLRVRVTNTGAKSFVFESKLNRKTIRRTIGDVKTWTIDQARAEARKLAVMLDNGTDPRELERQEQAERELQKKKQQEAEEAAKRTAVTVEEVWSTYVEERRPHWGEAHYQSHLEKASLGGQPSKRRGMTDKLTKPGPLAPLMPLALKDLDGPTIERWAAIEGKDRPSSARLALRQLSVFLNWCKDQPQYASILSSSNPTKSKKAREVLGKPTRKEDVLTREQLPAWFEAVKKMPNPTVSAYLQILLLTGARPGEVLELRWDDIKTHWRVLTIRDKVEGERVIPLTPYVHSLIAALPRRNDWVFSSAKTLRLDSKNIRRRAHKAAKRGTEAPEGDMLETSASGHITKPNTPHTQACTVAGIDGLTLHGLRRSFASLTEWLEIPAGVVAQIQGHKPSATAEKHYKRRPPDLLRLYHEKVEAWVLEQAGVTFENKAGAGKLALVG
ncbi:MAG TPA: integrase family protein [Burkholderiaceae bacterium]|nr:integrase family protein [Burkholderiaceae bacterium]